MACMPQALICGLSQQCLVSRMLHSADCNLLILSLRPCTAKGHLLVVHIADAFDAALKSLDLAYAKCQHAIGSSQ